MMAMSGMKQFQSPFFDMTRFEEEFRPLLSILKEDPKLMEELHKQTSHYAGGKDNLLM